MPMQRYKSKVIARDDKGEEMDDSRYDTYDEADINPIVGPCGGQKKYRTHLEADSGSPLEVAWSVTTPDDFGNCTISLNDGIEDEDGHIYEPMMPSHAFEGNKEK